MAFLRFAAQSACEAQFSAGNACPAPNKIGAETSVKSLMIGVETPFPLLEKPLGLFQPFVMLLPDL
jgi:hypothetical protein